MTRLLEIKEELLKIKPIQLVAGTQVSNNINLVYIDPNNYNDFIRYINNIKNLLSIDILQYKYISDAFNQNK